MSLINETVAVWVSPEGAPVRLVWRTRRFRVTDTPTPLTASLSLPDELLHFLTHPPKPVAAWRCQGTADDGTSLVFDIQHDDGRGLWQLLRAYD
ncbi:DUF6504 family protein [Cryobacterium sp. AP23]|jgi:hypothetical protein